MRLLDKRIAFTRCVGLLYHFAATHNMMILQDQGKRTGREAKWNAAHCRVMLRSKKTGEEYRCERGVLDPHHAVPSKGTHKFKAIGIEKSVHVQGLAQDLLIIENGEISNSRPLYDILGTYWKTLHPLARWGGDFVGFDDLGHFSFEHNGRE